MEKTTSEKISDELKVKDRPTKCYTDTQVGQIIDLLSQEIEDLKSRIGILEKK